MSRETLANAGECEWEFADKAFGFGVNNIVTDPRLPQQRTLHEAAAYLHLQYCRRGGMFVEHHPNESVCLMKTGVGACRILLLRKKKSMHPESNLVPCKTCQGSGYGIVPSGMTRECPQCEGTGKCDLQEPVSC